MPGFNDNRNVDSMIGIPLAAIAKDAMRINPHLHVPDQSMASGRYSHSHYDYMHKREMIPTSQYRAMRAVANHTPERLLDNNDILHSYRNEIPQQIYALHERLGHFFTKQSEVPNDLSFWDRALQFSYNHHIVWKAHREADLLVGAPSRTSSPVLYHGGVLSHCFAQTIMQSLLTPQQYAENEVYCDQAIQLAACTWNDVSQPAYKKAFFNGATTGGVTMVGLMMPARAMRYMPMKYKAMTFSLGFTYESFHQL